MRLIRILFAVYLTLVLLVTMWPSPETTSAPGWAQGVLAVAHGLGIPVTMAVLEASANVVMFLPFGLLGYAVICGGAARTWPAFGAVVVAGALMSALIETVQLAIPGRVSTLQDVVMNTLGAALGGLVAVAIVGLRDRRRRVSSRA